MALLDAGRAFGSVPRLPDALAFAHEARVLRLARRPSRKRGKGKA